MSALDSLPLQEVLLDGFYQDGSAPYATADQQQPLLIDNLRFGLQP